MRQCGLSLRPLSKSGSPLYMRMPGEMKMMSGCRNANYHKSWFLHDSGRSLHTIFLGLARSSSCQRTAYSREGNINEIRTYVNSSRSAVKAIHLMYTRLFYTKVPDLNGGIESNRLGFK